MTICYEVNYYLEWARDMRVPLRVIPAGLRAYSNAARFLVCRIVVAYCAAPTDLVNCPWGPTVGCTDTGYAGACT